MRRAGITVIAAIALFAVAGCTAETNGVSGVTGSSATLAGAQKCASDVDGRWAWQWRQLGTSDWSAGGAARLNCPRKLGYATPVSYPLRGLKPDTAYQFRLLLDLKQPCDLRNSATCGDVYPVDADGTVNGTKYDTFTTQPHCDDVQGAGESLAAFVGSNPPGTPADRRVLCVRQGTQAIGQVNGLKAWTTLTPRGKASGTKEIAVLNGNLGLLNRGITVEDVKVAGCYAQSGCGADRNKTIDLRAGDVTLRHVEITQQGGRNRDRLQCILIDTDSGAQPTGVRIEFSRIHSCGSESSGNLDHGLYCSTALKPMIVGNWFYDNEGYGVQLYPACDGASVIGNVIAENGGSCDVDGSNQVAYIMSFCGFGRENATHPVYPPIHCGPTSGSHAIDMVLYDPRSESRTTDCGSKLAQTRTLQADPQFFNRASYDFRMRNPLARAKLGSVYSTIQPGPRW